MPMYRNNFFNPMMSRFGSSQPMGFQNRNPMQTMNVPSFSAAGFASAIPQSMGGPKPMMPFSASMPMLGPGATSPTGMPMLGPGAASPSSTPVMSMNVPMGGQFTPMQRQQVPMFGPGALPPNGIGGQMSPSATPGFNPGAQAFMPMQSSMAQPPSQPMYGPGATSPMGMPMLGPGAASPNGIGGQMSPMSLLGPGAPSPSAYQQQPNLIGGRALSPNAKGYG
jgi:hypothetical protein